VRLSDVSGQDFVMYERTYAPGFHDLIFGYFAMPGLFPMFRKPQRKSQR